MNKLYQKCPINHQYSYFICQCFMFYKIAELVISFQHKKIKINKSHIALMNFRQQMLLPSSLQIMIGGVICQVFNS